MRGLAKSRDCFAPLVMTILAACDRTVTSLQRLQLTDTRFLTYAPQHGDKVFPFYGINFRSEAIVKPDALLSRRRKAASEYKT